MNKNQIITIIVGAICTFLASKLHIGIAPEDIQNGIVSLVILVFALVGKDANGADSILKNKLALTGIVTSIFWFVTNIFHLDLSDTVKGTVTTVLLYFIGYYQLNHSSIAHEMSGTVGTPSPTFAGK